VKSPAEAIDLASPTSSDLKCQPTATFGSIRVPTRSGCRGRGFSPGGNGRLDAGGL